LRYANGARGRRTSRNAPYATSTPAAVPSTDSKVPSIANCAASRGRAAPSALRVAISRCRASARDNRRLATLTARDQQQKEHRAEQRAQRGTHAEHDLVVQVVRHERVSVRVHRWAVPASPRCATNVSSSARAVESATPGLRRPRQGHAVIIDGQRRVDLQRHPCVEASASPGGKAKLSGITPTTV